MTAIGSLPRHRGRGRPAVEEPACSFARGMNYYKLFWVFFLCSFLGAVVETIFMFLTRGEIQDRSSVIYGPFSLVWGMGAVLFTLCFHRLAGRRDLLIFIGGTVLGGTYEYLCSWGQEVLFGARFWNYSHIPFNINGRVCLLYAWPRWCGSRTSIPGCAPSSGASPGGPASRSPGCSPCSCSSTS